MLDMQKVLEILEPHADALGAETMTEIKLSLVENDTPVDTAEIDRLTAELETVTNDYNAKIADFDARLSRFIKGEDPGDPGGEETPPPADEDGETEPVDFYAMYTEED